MLQCHATSLSLIEHVPVAAATLRGPYYREPCSQIREFTLHLLFPSFTTVGSQNPETHLDSGFVSFAVICAGRTFYDAAGISGWIKNMV